MSYEIAELKRRVANMIRIGVIGELTAGQHSATVIIAGDEGEPITTDPRPWLTGRAGPDADWHAPEPGEQVILLSPNGDMAQGAILPSLYSDAFPAPANSADIWRKQFANGSSIQYDRAAGKLTVDVGSGSVLVVANDATIDANESTCTGNLTVLKNFTVMGGSALNGGAIVQPGEGDGAAVNVNGSVNATDDVKAGDISLRNHPHGEIKRGDEKSGGPLP
jgi:phage baseplate assembly protein V